MATFPAATPGYVQLKPRRLSGSLELSFMFKTGQKRGLLLYGIDSSEYYYVSLSLVDGALELRIFPDVEISSAAGEGVIKAALFNDNEWHTVSLFIAPTNIQLHVDDHNYYRLEVPDPSRFIQLDASDYRFYIGGVSDDMTLMSGTTASNSPYIGCFRDLIVQGDVTDFNDAQHQAGVEKGVCRSEVVPEVEGKKSFIHFDFLSFYLFGTRNCTAAAFAAESYFA